FAGAAIGVPLAIEFFGIAIAIDKGGIKDIAAALPEGVEQDGARGEAAEVLKAQRHGRGLLAQARYGALGNDAAIGAERAIGQGVDAVGRGFNRELDPGIAAPL